MSAPRELEFWRQQLNEGARRSHPYGERNEERFPIRPKSGNDLDLRDNGRITDNSGVDVPGVDTLTP